jgi:hypothetical protein
VSDERKVQVACDRCTQGVMDATNPHLRGLCQCPCHTVKDEGVRDVISGIADHFGISDAEARDILVDACEDTPTPAASAGPDTLQPKPLKASYPTEYVVSLHGDPVWEAIWSVIKRWDLERERGYGYAGATGDDATRIYEAVAAALRREPSAPAGGGPTRCPSCRKMESGVHSCFDAYAVLEEKYNALRGRALRGAAPEPVRVEMRLRLADGQWDRWHEVGSREALAVLVAAVGPEHCETRDLYASPLPAGRGSEVTPEMVAEAFIGAALAYRESDGTVRLAHDDRRLTSEDRREMARILTAALGRGREGA